MPRLMSVSLTERQTNSAALPIRTHSRWIRGPNGMWSSWNWFHRAPAEPPKTMLQISYRNPLATCK